MLAGPCSLQINMVGEVQIVALLIGDDTIFLPAVRREAGPPRGRTHLADDPGSLAEEGSFTPYTAFCALDLPASPVRMPRLRWRPRVDKRH